MRKSEESFRGMIEGLPIGIYRTTPEGEIIAANEALLALLGYAEKEKLLSSNVRDFYVDVADRKRWKKEIEEQGILRGLQVLLRRPDGTSFWAEDNARIVRDEQGQILYYEGSLTDISERKQAEQAIRESETRYRNLLHNIPQKVFFKNTDLVYVAVNPSYAQDFNLFPADFVGKTDYDFYPSDLAKKYRADDRRILSSGIPEELDEVYFHQGVKRTVRTMKTPVRNEQDEVTGILGIFWDITDRKEMEEALRQSEQRYSGLFENSPVSLWEEDFSKVKDCIDGLRQRGIEDFGSYFAENPDAVTHCMSLIKVDDINQTTLDIFQAGSKEEFLSNLHKVFIQETDAVFKQELIAIAEGRKVFESEGRNGTLLGDTIDIHLRWSVAPGYEDTLSKVFVSIIDITERKQAEGRAQRQAAQAQALADISASLSAARLEPQAIYDIIVQRTANLIGDACVLTLVSDDREEIQTVAFHHLKPEAIPLMEKLLMPTPKRIGERAIRRVLSTGRPLLIPVVSQERLSEIVDPVYGPYLERFGIHSLLIIPLIALGKIIGTMGVTRDYPGDPYTEGDQAFLQNLANHAALTITNTRLHGMVKHQAHTDALTGVHNRPHFFNLAEIEFSRSERYGHSLSLFLLDLDHFKEINDTYGHAIGDQVLQAVTELFRTNIRTADSIGRYGGEEFTILLPEINLEGARHLAERLRACIGDAPIEIENKTISVTVSLGVASKGKDTPNLSALLNKADRAMYVAKRAGRNQVAFIP